jgi:hypothetical protein
MRYPVFVRSESSTSFIAEPLGIPELKTVASTERDALKQVEAALARWFAVGKLVHVSVPSETSGNPWIDGFGRSADDPDFDEFLEEVENARAADTTE